MLRHQPSSNAMSFLAGNSEMARRIREYDWDNHPFGSLGSWPQSLRSAVSICLNSAFPTAIYWGSELRLLYNDAWAPILGPRHPAALGASAPDVWSDIWHIIEPQFAHLIATGEGIFVEDQLLPMRFFGVVEEKYWNYSFTPIRGEDGAIAGVFNSGSETTRTVLSQRQMRFLLELGDAFRNNSDAHSARRVALEMVGKHLSVDRAGFREISLGQVAEMSLVEEWTAPGVPSVGPRVTLPESDKEPWATTQLKKGRVLRINDINDLDLDANAVEARERFDAMGIAAAVAVPWIVHGRTTSIIFLHSRKPRTWTDFEIATAQEVLERTLNWIERERAADRERIMTQEIDHRARNALTVVQAVVRQTVATSVADFRRKIEDRIAALARTHALLSSEHWQPVELELLLNQELAPYVEQGGTAIQTGGPKVLLRPEQAQTMALLLHELTTNAAKYGALSLPQGRLEVTWSREQSGVLTIHWLESALSAKRPAPRSKQRGFGTTLLSRVVQAQLGGSILRSFKNGWLQCILTIPLGSDKVETTAIIGRHAEIAANRGSTDPMTVLIVEDEAMVAMDLECMVEELGYKVFGVASNVDSGVAMIETANPTFAIIDINLAGESALPLAETLIARGIPIAFSTGYAEIPGINDALAAAPRLTKPISASELAKTLADLQK